MLSKTLSEVHGRDVPPCTSLWSLLREGLAKSLDKPALVCCSQPREWLSDIVGRNDSKPEGFEETSHLVWTYRQLERGSAILTRTLVSLGVNGGSTIAIFHGSTAEAVLTIWAATRLNATLMFLSEDQVRHTHDTAHMLRLVKPSHIIIHDPAAARDFDSSLEYCTLSPTIKKLFFRDSSKPQHSQYDMSKVEQDGWLDLLNLMRRADEENKIDSKTIEDPLSKPPNHICMIATCSGLTSNPKLCPRTATVIASAANIYTTVRKWTSSDAVVLTGQYTLVQALTSSVAMWRVGGCVVLPARQFDSAATLYALSLPIVTQMATLAIYARQVLAHADVVGVANLHPIHCITVGGQKFPRSLIDELASKLKATHVFPVWGMTEAHSIVGWEDTDKVTEKDGILGAGKVVPGAKVRVVEPGTRAVVRRGEVGEFHLTGSSVSSHYMGHEHEQLFYVDDTGRWFKTGDAGFIDDDGIIYVTGRCEDDIIHVGRRYPPATYESCIRKHLGIEVQVIGVPTNNDILGDKIVIVVPKMTAGDDQCRRVNDVMREFYPSLQVDHVISLDTFDVDGRPLQKSELKEAAARMLG